jgi:DNA-binding NarL/FixJ family response regulator
LNFVLYLAWNVIAVRAFLRDDRHSDVRQPGDLLAGGEIPSSLLGQYGITGREAEVIRLVAQGLPNKQIASDLGVSFATVRTHLYNVFRKTGVSSRIELVRLLSGRM